MRGGRTLSMGQGWHMSGGPQGLLAVTARKNLAGQVMMYEKLLGCGVWRRIQESSQHIGNSKRSPSMECAGVGARLVGKLPCACEGVGDGRRHSMKKREYTTSSSREPCCLPCRYAPRCA